jgi:hypothetical protein
VVGKQLKLALLSCVAFLSACGGGGGGDGNLFCPSNNPAPRIDGIPGTQATVGQQYRFFADAEYSCLGGFPLPIIPGLCGAIEGVQLPPGAQAVGGTVLWTPSASDVNANVSFRIQTPSDLCGGRASRSWVVSVQAAPSIQSFVSSASEVFAGQAVGLTATFVGAGTISGVGNVTSGVQVTTPPLTESTRFDLRVSNAMGVSVSQSLVVNLIGPPSIQSFSASPSRIGNGSTSTLSWTLSGQATAARIDPGAIDVTGASSTVVAPTANTTYVLTISNPSGTTSATRLVEVIQNANIQSFTATPASTAVGGAVQISAQFLGEGFIDKDVNGTFQLLQAVASGDMVSSGPLYRSTRFRLRVENPSDESISSDLLVALTGPGTFRFTSGQPLSATRVNHTATLLNDGRVLIAYGITSDGLFHLSEFFDPATETFTRGPRLVADQHSGVSDFLLADGRVLFVRRSQAFVTDTPVAIDVYDPVANGFSLLRQGPASIFFNGLSLRLADGRILIRVRTVVSGSMRAGVMTFDPATNVFGPFIAYAQQTTLSNASRLGDGRVLFIAGDGTTQIFTPGSDAFSSGPAFALARSQAFTSISLADGNVLVVGGMVPDASAAELYVTATDSVRFVGAPFFGNLLAPSAVNLANGKVLLVAGSLQVPFGQPVPWAEIFDPATGNFAPTGGLRTVRTSPGSDAVTRLADGRVVVIGGCQGLPCEAEIYTP